VPRARAASIRAAAPSRISSTDTCLSPLASSRSLAVMIGCALAVGWRARQHGGWLRVALPVRLHHGLGRCGDRPVREEPTGRGRARHDPVVPARLRVDRLRKHCEHAGWLAAFANWNPMSAVVAATRQLFGNDQGVPVPDVWSLQHPVVTTLGMSVILLGVMVPLAVRRYCRIAR
jgi:hypothetical protein